MCSLMIRSRSGFWKWVHRRFHLHAFRMSQNLPLIHNAVSAGAQQTKKERIRALETTEVPLAVAAVATVVVVTGCLTPYKCADKYSFEPCPPKQDFLFRTLKRARNNHFLVLNPFEWEKIVCCSNCTVRPKKRPNVWRSCMAQY